MILDEDDQDDGHSPPDVIKLTMHNDSSSGLAYYSLPVLLVVLCQVCNAHIHCSLFSVLLNLTTSCIEPQNEIDIDTLNVTNQHPFVIDGQIVCKKYVFLSLSLFPGIR